MNRLQLSYHLLGLSPGSSLLEVRRAYRDLVRVWHPDLFPHNPALQLHAQEKLKGINEAYQLLQAELSGRQGTPPLEPCAKPDKPAPSRGSARPAAAIRTPPASPYPVGAIFPFFTAWQNILFLLLVAGTLYFINFRYGTLAFGAVYGLRMLTVPLLFSLVCNSRWGNRGLFWKGYVGVVGVCGALLLTDAVVFTAGVQNASSHRYAPAQDGGTRSYDFAPQPGSPVIHLDAPWQQSPSGPVSPVSPAVSSPSSPTAPSAPATPASPTTGGVR